MKPHSWVVALPTLDLSQTDMTAEHTRVRRLVQQAFTPQRVAAMEPHTREIVRRLLGEMREL